MIENKKVMSRITQREHFLEQLYNAFFETTDGNIVLKFQSLVDGSLEQLRVYEYLVGKEYVSMEEKDDEIIFKIKAKGIDYVESNIPRN